MILELYLVVVSLQVSLVQVMMFWLRSKLLLVLFCCSKVVYSMAMKAMVLLKFLKG